MPIKGHNLKVPFFHFSTRGITHQNIAKDVISTKIDVRKKNTLSPKRPSEKNHTRRTRDAPYKLKIIVEVYEQKILTIKQLIKF